MISYDCHLFADKLNTVTLQNELSKLNRLACLSLGSVPPGTPTMAMEILLNLRPLDLEMQQIAIKTYGGGGGHGWAISGTGITRLRNITL
jgi:hypothetical protein